MLRSRLAVAVFALSVVPLGQRAAADPMDPTIHRFGVTTPTGHTPCSFDGTNMTAGVTQCYADNDSYQRLMLQLGNAMSLGGLSPARTTGYRHFYVGFEAGVTSLNGVNGADPPAAGSSDAQFADWRSHNYLRLGTQGNSITAGDVPAQQARYEQGNALAQSRLTWTRIAFRKGLPLGLEIGGSAGRFLQTSMWAFAFEIKWALLEGFRSRWPAAFPDFAVRAGVTSIAGVNGFQLTVPTLGFTISKEFVLGHAVQLTPYITGQAVWIMADSEVIDVTPGNANDNDGDQSLVTFDRVRAWHPRIAAGLQVRYERFLLNTLFRMDVSDPLGAFSVAQDGQKQWTLELGTGVMY